MHCKICVRILFEQAPSTLIDKLSKENRLQLHRQTPHRSLKVTAMALPPCCKDAPASYFESETRKRVTKLTRPQSSLIISIWRGRLERAL